MNMKTMEELKERLCRELDDVSKSIANRKDSSDKEIDLIYKLTDSIKNIDKIMMIEDGDIDGYSRADGYRMPGEYDRGNSYANRGKHYVRGHYSRDGRDGYDDGYSERRRDSRGRYSRDGDVVDRMQEMLRDADDHERKVIERCIKELNE